MLNSEYTVSICSMVVLTCIVITPDTGSVLLPIPDAFHLHAIWSQVWNVSRVRTVGSGGVLACEEMKMDLLG